jgi:hypothetical protein
MYVNGKLRPAETIPGMLWGVVSKGEGWRGGIQV